MSMLGPGGFVAGFGPGRWALGSAAYRETEDPWACLFILAPFRR